VKTPEPAGPVQIFPRGLLGLLQLKGLSSFPTTLNMDYQPVIEMIDWFMETNARQEVAQPNSVVATGGFGFSVFTPAIVVPQTQFWYVVDFNIRANLVAGDTVTNLRPAIRYDNVGPSYGIPDPSSIASGSGAASSVWCGARGFWMPPGSELALHLGAITAAANISFAAEVRFVPLDI
jgi:hypothetical protein